MFHKMRREKQALSMEQCLDILENSSSGVLALYGEDGYPYAVPLSYLCSGGRLIFHGAKSGHKLEAIKHCDRASFCVIQQDEVIPEKYTSAYRSVIVFGRMRIIEDETEKRQLAVALAEKYRPGHIDAAAQEAEAYKNALCIFTMEIEHISGKQGKELL